MWKAFRLYPVLLLTLVTALVLAACGNGGTTAPGDAADEPSEARATDVAGDTDTTTGDDGTVTAGDVDSDSPAPSTAETISVGSKDFGEQFILGEMYALLLEQAGFTVERNLNLGGTPVAHQALLNGDIDLYPEYTSTGLLTVLSLPQIQDANEIIETVRSEYEEQFQLTWLEPAPFNNTQALATTQAIADEFGIRTYSDLAEQASNLRLGGPAEFQEREDGLPGLQEAYGGFEFAEYVQLGTGSLRYQAIQSGEIDVVVAFGTDGPIVAQDLVVLEDDQGFYPIYQVAPVVRVDTLTTYPQIADALNQLAPLLTDEVMQGLNLRVDVEGEDFAVVAREFLVENGLITE